MKNSNDELSASDSISDCVVNCGSFEISEVLPTDL